MLSVQVAADRRLTAREVPEPVPAPDEAVVEVLASSVNRGELALIAMRGEGWRPGQDVAGVVAAAAQDGSGPARGTRVVGLAEQGAWSERVAVRASRLAEVPVNVELETAAALPMAGLTALRTVRSLGSILGAKVLVTGPRGGVGSLQVQLARLGGADVTGLVRAPGSGESESGFVSDLGDGGAFDAALDAIGGDTLRAVVGSLRPGGKVVWFGSGSAEPTALSIYDFVGHEGVSISTYFSYVQDPLQDADDLGVLLRLVEQGTLQLDIDSRWPLTDAQTAMERMSASGVRGKVLLTAIA
ncbi:zinc-binding dehydrogenase [Microbacterium sp. SORGH_AS_0862]|uniref:zinc-binding dehydrogenase n=1 Tax=Microbacterium sp. SORGH_AS_0862 TaxID=3041789 RepID=UPI00278F1ACD|nr:zinc-binding dehydrogenase [Microbacterium sp. SORGH_AS_0862]MDQ1203882.1 NADPH2:quinone reductase [Microbacterium sp. SORGH_AS_0862]